MAVHDSGGAVARLSESFQQTDDKFLDHVETVRMCTASASSQTCRSVLQGYDVFFGPKLNNPLYLSGEPKESGKGRRAWMGKKNRTTVFLRKTMVREILIGPCPRGKALYDGELLYQYFTDRISRSDHGWSE